MSADIIVQISGRRKLDWDSEDTSGNQAVQNQPRRIVLEVKAASEEKIKPAAKSSASGARSGNGHARARKRSLTEMERNCIRKFFVAKNGVLANDDCTKLHKLMGDGATVFQVTGFVTSLHGEVRRGSLKLSNIKAYESHLRQRRTLWATYDSPRYKAMRAKLLGDITPELTVVVKA
jgi:hypothetical protein